MRLKLQPKPSEVILAFRGQWCGMLRDYIDIQEVFSLLIPKNVALLGMLPVEYSIRSQPNGF